MVVTASGEPDVSSQDFGHNNNNPKMETLKNRPNESWQQGKL